MDTQQYSVASLFIPLIKNYIVTALLIEIRVLNAHFSATRFISIHTVHVHVGCCKTILEKPFGWNGSLCMSLSYPPPPSSFSCFSLLPFPLACCSFKFKKFKILETLWPLSKLKVSLVILADSLSLLFSHYLSLTIHTTLHLLVRIVHIILSIYKI